MSLAARNDQYTLSFMLTEAERRNSTIPANTCASEDIKNLIDTREPCSGNTALHWASKFGV